MTDQPPGALTDEQVAVLTELAGMENARLEEAASLVTQQAFNLGCFVGTLPGIFFLLASLLLTDFSVIGAAISLVLISIGLIAFANLAAMLARRNTIRRVYRDQSERHIEQTLNEAGCTRGQFEQVIRQVLPPQAALFSCLTISPSSSTRPKLLVLQKRKEK